MSFDIDLSGLDELAARLDALPEQIEQAKEEALDVLAEATLRHKVDVEVEQTYQRPTSGNYTRTGNFRDNQTVESEPGTRIIGPRGPSEAYEGRLAVIPPGRDGIDRRNPAAENTVLWLEDNGNQIFEDAFRDALERQ